MSQMMTSLLARDPSSRTTTGRRRRLAVVAPGDSAGSPWFPLLCVALLLVGLGAVLGLNTAMAQDSFEVQRLEARSAELGDTQESLTHEINAKSAPQHLAEQAEGLGMVPPESAAFIDLDKGTVVGVATAATRPEGLTVDASTNPTASEKDEEEASSASGGESEKRSSEATDEADEPSASPSSSSSQRSGD